MMKIDSDSESIQSEDITHIYIWADFRNVYRFDKSSRASFTKQGKLAREGV